MSPLIGIYDSGLGGLSVLRAVRDLLPEHNLCYLADSAYVPYGPRSAEEVRRRACACTGWLVDQHAEIVVVACNTASSAALELLRDTFSLPIVGMEPGVKPAIHNTRTRHVGVLATSGTLTGSRFARLVQRFAGDVKVQAVACPELVEQVEAGELDSQRTRDIVARYLCPLRTDGVDTVVLGCTHFNFLAPVIAELAGPDMTIIDTAPAVARRVAYVVEEIGLSGGQRMLNIRTTGNPAQIAPLVARILQQPLPVEHVGVE
jgi:glutamate racemase